MEKREARAQARPKYIWDATKLAWVEAKADDVQESPPEPPDTKPEAPKEEPTERIRREARSEVAPQAQTPETPVLQYRGVLIRIAAIFIDYVVLFTVLFIVTRVTSVPTWAGVLMGAVYFIGFWSWRGQTPGKIVIGARIVRPNGEHIDIGRAIIRFIFYFIPTFGPILYLAGRIDYLPLVLVILAGIVVAANTRKKGIHDFAAGTAVINTRASAAYSAQPEGDEAAGTEAGPSTAS